MRPSDVPLVGRLFPGTDRRSDADEVEPGVFVGSAAAARTADPGDYDRVVTVADGLHLDVTTDGFDLVVDRSVLHREAEFRRAVATVRGALSRDQRVLVHCHAGQERAPAVVAAALAVERGLRFGEALERIEAERPVVDPTPPLRELGRRYVSDHE